MALQEHDVDHIAITVTLPEASKDAVMHHMTELGCIGFSDEGTSVTGYFGQGRTAAELCEKILAFGPVLGSSGLDSSLSCSHELLPDRDWNEEWKKNFQPIDVGEGLTIVPSWLKVDTGRTPIIIDPGMVFGTGHHETTRTCLRLIERYAAEGTARRFLDVGTGTGILAISAARLGYTEVVAVDIDPLAVDAAARNAAANGLSGIQVLHGTFDDVSGSFDLIAANLLSEILTAAAPQIRSRLASGGTAILSGMLSGQEPAVIEAMRSAGLLLREQITDGKWVTLVMERPG